MCQRGCNQKGTMNHIWWDCPKIRDYWQRVQQYIGEITGTDLPDDHRFCLFHNIKITIKQYKNTVKTYPDPESPTIEQWIKRIEHIHTIGYLRCSEEDQIERFSITWVEYKKTRKYTEIWREQGKRKIGTRGRVGGTK